MFRNQISRILLPSLAMAIVAAPACWAENEETIILDYDHPLAGQALNLDLKTLAIE